MARTINQIYDALCISKASMQELHSWVVDQDNPNSILDNSETYLQDLTTNSKVAIWRTWLWVVAAASWIIETLFDTHKQEIADILSKARPMTLRWYSEQSKIYQYGYQMIWKDNAYSYEVIDENAKIIKYAAASEKDGKVRLKVATLLNGIKVPLNNLQKATFSAFWAKWRPAGVKMEIISLASDQMKVTMTIIRDRLVLAADNSLLRDASVFPIADAIKKFSDNLEFDGILRISKLEDAIQAAEGVVDVKVDSAQAKAAGGAYSPIDMYYELASGYITLSWSESIITYIDNVNVVIQT
jgi:hypothetical protein